MTDEINVDVPGLDEYSGAEFEDERELIGGLEQGEWLELSRGAFRTSTDYFDSSLRRQWEKNLSMFRSKHPKGSKYHAESYKYRSKTFRPKTRSAITRNEAQAAEAFFSTNDLVVVEPQNVNDDFQVLAAELNAELLNYRLEETIPWFLTCIGAFQDAMTIGAVVSKQYWNYEEREADLSGYMPAVGPDGQGQYDEYGDPVMEARGEILKDEPAVDLLPIENVRFDPAADWRDVVGTSPYWITIMPMYLGEVRERMASNDPKTGQPKWKPADDSVIQSATKMDNDSVRRARHGDTRQDPEDRLGREGDFQLVWVHENIIRHAGQDWLYYTLGNEHMLTDPVPLREVYFHGQRPYVMGYCSIETHKTVPAGAPEVWEGIQTEVNDIANQRLDNVKLVLNTRYFVASDQNVDTRSLRHAVPGGIVTMEDINTSVKADRPADVTASSYQEQDRLNVDFDEIAGSFSPGSVQSNRQLNETVGGMEMLSGDSNTLTAYRLRIFTETWVEPVLRQLIKLEQAYETDETVLAIAGQRAEVFDEWGMVRIPEGMLETPVKTSVDVGFGSTNPQQRIDKMNIAMSTVANTFQIPGVNAEEVRKVVFGALGYKDGSRFFHDEEEGADPEKQEMMARIQELEAMVQGKQAEIEGKLQIEQMRGQTAKDIAALNARSKMQIEQAKAGIAQIDKKLKAAELKGRNNIETQKLINQRQALVFQMQTKQAELLRSNQQDRMSQVIANDQYGMIPGQDDSPGKG